ncbi:MAG TPA: hypothetical protein DCW88_05835 [Agrobacterium sp.]|nr:hypothetical protein [Agrobacterium sp.]
MGGAPKGLSKVKSRAFARVRMNHPHQATEASRFPARERPETKPAYYSLSSSMLFVFNALASIRHYVQMVGRITY